MLFTNKYINPIVDSVYTRNYDQGYIAPPPIFSMVMITENSISGSEELMETENTIDNELMITE